VSRTRISVSLSGFVFAGDSGTACRQPLMPLPLRAVSCGLNAKVTYERLVPGSTQSLVIQEQQQITRLQRVLRRSASAQSQRKGAVAPCSWTPQESQVERCEHQDDSNIHCQPFPESVSEEHEIYTDYDGCHRHHVKHDSYLSAHFSPWFNRNKNRPPSERHAGNEKRYILK